MNTDSRIYSKHALGLLVSIINNCTLRPTEIKYSVPIIESCLYLLWTHFNIYFIENASDKLEGIDSLKVQAEGTFNDAFFSKIQTVAQKNTFVDALSRRIKRTIYLKRSSNLLQIGF